MAVTAAVASTVFIFEKILLLIVRFSPI